MAKHKDIITEANTLDEMGLSKEDLIRQRKKQGNHFCNAGRPIVKCMYYAWLKSPKRGWVPPLCHCGNRTEVKGGKLPADDMLDTNPIGLTV